MDRHIVMEGVQTKAGRCLDSAFAFLFLLAGVYGFLLSLSSVEGLSWNPWLAGGFALLPGCILWLIARKKKGWVLCSCVSIAALIALPFLLYPDSVQQLQLIFLQLSGANADAEVEVTGAVLLLILAVSLFLFILEFLFRAPWPLYILTTVFLLTGPFFGIDPSPASIFLTIAFQLVFWSMHNMQRRRQKELGTSRRQGTFAKKIGAITLAGIAGLFFISQMFVSRNADWLYQTAYQAEGFLQRTFKQISGNVDDPTDGAVSRGNLYPVGTEQLELWSNLKPTETIYLRSFSGGTYQNGEWQQSNDRELFVRMEENSLHWDIWSDWIPNMYRNLYFVMNTSTAYTQEDSRPAIRELFIQHTNGKDLGDIWYVPYYSLWSNHSQVGNGENGYTYLYFQQDEMNVQWGDLDADYATSRLWYYEIQEAYIKEAKDLYTRVPEDTLPRLVKLCEENPMDTFQQITAFIRYTLQNYASYSRTPGLFPLNKDPVEYFLFENGEGYCQHFASAATLMYRLYGIPARYATGYAVPPSSFEQMEDGSYHAVITDEAAHAWPEVFLEDQGWTPIEVTPSQNQQAIVTPGMDRASLEQLLGGQNLELGVFEQTQGSSPEDVEAETDTPLMPGVSMPSIKIDPSSLLLCAGYILLFSVAGYLIYRMSRLRAIKNMDSQKLFSTFLDALHTAGLLMEYKGLEEDLSIQLSCILPDCSQEQSKEILRTVNESAFGNTQPSKEKEDRVREFYDQEIHSLYATLSKWKKFIFKYIKVFL